MLKQRISINTNKAYHKLPHFKWNEMKWNIQQSKSKYYRVKFDDEFIVYRFCSNNGILLLCL